MMIVSCSPISEFLSFIVTGLSLWVSFLLYMVTALRYSPMGGFLLSSIMTQGLLFMGVFSHIWWQVPAPPYADSSLLYTVGGSYLLSYKWISLLYRGSFRST
jgi:hypothetical protein